MKLSKYFATIHGPKDMMIAFKQRLLTQPTIVSFVMGWLLAANLSYLFFNNPLGWLITLTFFLSVPGYLLMCLLNGLKLARPLVLSFSVGLSILLLMAAGLLLNTTFLIGVNRPLSTANIFIILDVVSVVLLLLCKKNLGGRKLQWFKRPGTTSLTIILLSTMMPILAALGAIRLNNGASNVLTLVLFAFMAVVFVWVAARSKLEGLFPYVLFSMALAILFTTSLRGWYNTGHDVQAEYLIFQLTAKNAHWSIAAFRHAYNACLSLTILPTILLKLTHVPPLYIFKVIYQVIFAFSIMPIYLFMEKVSNKRTAFFGAFIFITLPAFLNYMPMLNRQEIGTLFFALLMLAIFTTETALSNKARKSLIILLLFGLILSHYSSMYIAIALLSAAGLVGWILGKAYKRNNGLRPLVGFKLIAIAFLLTLGWNLQFTNTGQGINAAVSSTVQNLLDHTGQQSNSVSYSLIGRQTQSPPELLSNYANHTASQVQYAGQPNLPPTKLGSFMGHLLSPESFNNILRVLSAKILQVLLLLGAGVLVIRSRRKLPSRDEAYFLALIGGCMVILALQTLLPQLSIDYGTLRFFQQMAIILAVPMVIGLQKLIAWPNKKTIITAVFLAGLFLDLSGFVPEVTGGYPPQLALNNSGLYYESYYVHKAELLSSGWLLTNKKPDTSIEMDKYAKFRFLPAIMFDKLKITSLTSINKSDYIYQDTANVATNTYQIAISGAQIRYTLKQDINSQKNLIYSDGGSKVYK